MKFPRKKAEALIAWMKSQMYDGRTDWTFGDKRDRMADCVDFLQMLVEKYDVDGIRQEQL